MLTLDSNLGKNDEHGVENDSIWIQTPLRNFGPKYIMNKHDLCTDVKCKCLCHSKKSSQG